MKKTTLKFLGMGLATAVCLSPVARGQMGQQQGMGQQQTMSHQQSTGQQTQGQTPPGQPQAQTAPATPPPVNPQEEADYKKLSADKSTDWKAIVTQTNDFLKKYPDSRYNSMVYYKQASAYLQLGDAKMAGGAAQKSYDLNPDNVDVLPLMAYLIARQIGEGPGAAQKTKAAEDYAHKAIQMLNNLQKQPDMSDADFEAQRKEKLSMAQSALGLAYLNENKAMEAAQALSEAIHLSAVPDPVDEYLLGVAYDNTQKYSQAVTAYEACAKDPLIGDRCRANLKDAKEKAAHQ
jgi:tetratricopeptide (TPR) repeat protein